ncbi:MAG: ATP-binding protein, partial [Elusimicrobia bacterium]|nr:ATP-binding protein [Elusimicrobiota bacterium]
SSITAVTIRQHIDDVTKRLAFIEDVERSLSARNAKGAEAEIKRAMKSNPAIILSSVVDKTGAETFTIGTEPALETFSYLDLSDDPVFLNSLKTLKIVFSKFGSYGQMPAAAVVCPMKSGHFLYLIISFSELWAKIQRQKIGITGRIYLADSTGKVFSFLGENVPAMSAQTLKEMFRADDGKIADIKTSAGKFAGAYEKVPDIDLFALTLQSKEETFWLIKLTSSLILFFILAIATASYFAALYYAKDLSRPVAEIVDGARRVSNKNFDSPLDEKRAWGEFKGLFRSFNSMMGEIKKYNELQIDKVMEEKAKTDLLIRLMRDGVVLAATSGEQIFANEPAEKILQSLVAPEGRYKNRADAVKSLATGEKKLVQAQSGRQKISYKVVSEFYQPKNSEPVILLVLRDVTVERELDELKEELFGSVAHDLRAPLLGIQGYIKLLESSGPDKIQLQYIEAMKSSSQRVIRLIEDILDIARMESGTLQPKKSRFKAAGTAAKVLESLKPLAQAKNIFIALNAPDEITLNADERLFERLLENLLSNAIKYTGPGGKISLNFLHDKLRTLILVEDTGIGIAKDRLDAIFEKYKRLQTADGTSGFGLGLAVSKKIVEMHGGEIKAESETGKGTKIIVSLPS